MAWYAKGGSGGQGLVIDKDTGRNIAVAYDVKDATLLAAAPKLHCVLSRLAEKSKQINNLQHAGIKVTAADWSDLHQIANEAQSIIHETEENLLWQTRRA